MATFKEETSLYEILIRVNPDKTWAAHYQTLTEIKKDDIVISATTSDVSPLTPENLEAFEIVRALVGDVTANTVKDNEVLKSIITHLEEEIEKLKESSAIE